MYPPPTSSSGAAPANKAVTLNGRLTTALHIGIACVALSIAFVLFDGSLFAWHPALMSIGYIGVMAEGLIIAIHFRQTDGSERVKAIWSHAVMQLRAAVLVIIGFGVIYRNKVLHGKPHFVSLHAKFGLATLVLSILMPLWGAASFRRLGIVQRFPERWQPRIKALHRQLGLATWLLALVTVQLALPHPAVSKGLVTTAWQVGVAAVGGLMLLLAWKAGAASKAPESAAMKTV